MSPYETFEHTADIGLRVCAPDLPSLFAEAGRGLLAILAGDVGSVRCTVERRLRLRADGTENLLVDWLSEILFLFETEGLLLARFEVTISPQGGGRGGRGGARRPRPG